MATGDLLYDPGTGHLMYETTGGHLIYAGAVGTGCPTDWSLMPNTITFTFSGPGGTAVRVFVKSGTSYVADPSSTPESWLGENLGCSVGVWSYDSGDNFGYNSGSNFGMSASGTGNSFPTTVADWTMSVSDVTLVSITTS